MHVRGALLIVNWVSGAAGQMTVLTPPMEPSVFWVTQVILTSNGSGVVRSNSNPVELSVCVCVLRVCPEPALITVGKWT